MEVLINSKTDVDHEIEIVVPDAELQPHFEKAYREEARNIVMPGFRRGKVPLQIVKRRFGQAIEAQVIEKLSNSFFQDALKERDIQPVGQPVLHDLRYEPGEPLVIKIAYETNPTVVARDYTGLQLERLRHEVTEDEVEEELGHMRKGHRTMEEVERADDEQHVVTCEIRQLDAEGNVIPEKVNDHFVVDLDDENLHRDLKAELLNMEAGEEKEIEITEEHDGHEHVEKFRVKVKKVEHYTLPELDDAFAATATGGAAQTVDAARALIRGRLEEAWSARYKTQLEEDLINQILERNPFDVPRGIVDGILDQWVDELRKRQPGQKLPASFQEQEYRDARRPQAVQAARWMFLRESITEQEKIEVTDADLEAKAAEDASRYGIAAERLLEFYTQNEQMRGPILTEKIMAHLVAAADVRDVDDDELSHTALAPIQEMAAQAAEPVPAEETDEADTDSDKH